MISNRDLVITPSSLPIGDETEMIRRIISNNFDINLVNRYLETNLVSDQTLNSLIANTDINKDLREVLKQYRTLKISSVSDFLSKSYQEKNNTNLMVIAARSYLSILRDKRLSKNNPIINAQNVDGNTAVLFAINNLENLSKSLWLKPSKVVSGSDEKRVIILYQLLTTLLTLGSDTLISNHEGKSGLESLSYCIIYSKTSSGYSQILRSYVNDFVDRRTEIISSVYTRLLNESISPEELRYILILCDFSQDQLNQLSLHYQKQKLYEHNSMISYYLTLMQMNISASLFDIATLGYFSLMIYSENYRHAVKYLNRQDSAGNTPLHLPLKNPNNIVMVRFLMRNKANVSVANYANVTPYSILQQYANDPTIRYQKGYQKLLEEYAEGYPHKSTFLDLIPKEIASLIEKYIYFQPLPITQETRLPEELHKTHPGSILVSYVPITIPLRKERDLPYVQKIGGYSYYLQQNELDIHNINNPTYIDDKRRDFYELHSQFVDPRPGYENYFVRIHIKSTILDAPTNKHSHLFFIKEIDNLSPTESINIDYQNSYYNKHEIIGWHLIEELDRSSFDRSDPIMLHYVWKTPEFKVGGYDDGSQGKCTGYDYLNIKEKYGYIALSINGQACYSQL